MRSKFIYIVLLLFPVLAFSQKDARQLLRGQMVADSIKVENITVLNTTSNIKAITDDNGNFNIYARPTDTLFFSSITFRPAMLVLKKEHFEEARLQIKMEVNVTVLEEIIIIPLTGDLSKDSKRRKTLQITSQMDSQSIIKSAPPKETVPVNKALPQTESQLQGVNFSEIYRMIFKKKARADTGEQYLNGKTFPDIVKDRYSYHFFTQTLKIPHDEIGLFLNFCDKGTSSFLLLNPEKEFELTDFLVESSKEYLKKDK